MAAGLDFLGRFAYSSRAMAGQPGESETPFQQLVAGVSQAAKFIVASAKKIGTDRFVIIGSLAVIAVYVVFVLYLWRQEFFEIPEEDAGVEVVAAVVALLGGLFAALLTFAGVLLKHSLDTRAEKRLKLDTFVRAAQLLATDTGEETPATQQATALFVLVDLGHLNFALALLGEIWPKQGMSPDAACWLIDKCLQSADQDIQADAANMLLVNANSLSEVECFSWPRILWRSWPASITGYARLYILQALIRCLMSKSAEKWSSQCLNGFLDQLVRIKEEEDDDDLLRNGATIILDTLLSHAMFKDHENPILDTGTLDLGKLREDVHALAPSARLKTYTQFVSTATELQTWMDKSPPDEPSPAVVDGR